MTSGDGVRRWAASLVITTLMMLATAINSPAQFTSLVTFTGANGSQPFQENLVQGKNGNLYGTTTYGGTHSDGTIFEVTPAGKLTTIYNFAGTDGANPYAGLVLGSDGNFYGTTFEGGANGDGTVFKITPSNTLTTLYSFCKQTNCTDGALPYGALVEGTNGNYYGTTEAGGAYPSASCTTGCGTVFKITPTGTLTTLHSFDYSTDGYYPYGGLVLGSGGVFFGTTTGGPGSGYGTVFKITSGGTFTPLYSFVATADGWEPEGALIQATDGNFYGTTLRGGASGDGEVFKITAGGTFKLLHSFASLSEGYEPAAGLVQASDGNFYGTTVFGGTYFEGNIFEISSGGTVTPIHSFSSGAGGTDGNAPYGGLVQRTDGVLFGTTGAGGGSGGLGTVFSQNQGLKAFVKTVPTSGKVGSTVTILGTNIASATKVTFNGVTATVTKNTASYITTKVPTGATTGKAEVYSPGCTCSTLVNFVVP